MLVRFKKEIKVHDGEQRKLGHFSVFCSCCDLLKSFKGMLHRFRIVGITSIALEACADFPCYTVCLNGGLL